MGPNTTLIINSKGGSGKTTVTTNLASYFASRSVPTTILDYDPQGSSLNWLRLCERSGTKLCGANCIVIPVAPSAFDIYATANFVKDLLLVGRIRSRSIRLAVVANRVRSAAPVYRPLERFLGSLGLPFLTRISDSEVYVTAAETGIGIFEMDAQASAAEREE